LTLAVVAHMIRREITTDRLAISKHRRRRRQSGAAARISASLEMFQA